MLISHGESVILIDIRVTDDYDLIFEILFCEYSARVLGTSPSVAHRSAEAATALPHRYVTLDYYD